MTKVIDITEKLSFEESPRLKIKDLEIRVNDDAPTMLKVMQKIGDNITPADIYEVYGMLIPEEDREKIDALKLNFNSFKTVVKSAISVVTGSDLDEAAEGE